MTLGELDKILTKYSLEIGTEAFQNFYRSLKDSYILIDIISEGGNIITERHNTELKETLEEVTKVNIDDLLKLTDEDKEKLYLQAADNGFDKLYNMAEKADGLQRIGRETVNYILLIFLVTIFEAYVENLLISVFSNRLELIEWLNNRGGKGKKPHEPIETRIKKLLYAKSLSDLAIEPFKEPLKISLTSLCCKANTTIQELDKAKALRNIHIHNQGLVDDKFRIRIGDPTLKIGEPYPVTIDYLTDIKTKILMIVFYLDREFVEKFSLKRSL